MSPGSLSFAALGETAQLAATVLDQNGQAMQGRSVTWASSAPAVATVNASGLVTAVGVGSATITATSGSATGTASVTVTQEAASVEVTPVSVEFTALGDTVRLTATVLDANGSAVAGAVVAWSSGDSAVATVNASGLVTAVGSGATTVTAESGGATGTANVTVGQEGASVEVSPDSLEFTALGDTVRLTATVLDANGSTVAGAVVAWSSGDAAVATVDSSGLVTAIGSGATTVTAESGGATGTANVTVGQEGASVEVSPDSLEFTALGDTVRLTATVLDANGSTVAGAVVAWSSGDAAVATVDSSGLVTAIGSGATTVTATAGDLAASAQVEVVLLSSDRDVLEHFYRQTGGDGWYWKTNWMTDRPLNQWAGVKTDDNGRVTAIALSRNNMQGRLSAALGQLDRLERLVLYENDITGSIPPAWGRLANLVVLDLDNNDLEGAIPPEIGGMAALDTLVMFGNRLSGPIPAEMGQLSSLRKLDLGANRLTGPIPLALANLTSLSVLGLHDNRLTGPIPSELGNLAAVVFLDLSRNQLTGPIPGELGRLSRMKEMWLGDNLLSGPIPPELGNLTNVEEFAVGYNQLTGSIPPELGRLANVKALRLSDNPLTGPIPPELGQLSRMTYLALMRTNVSGPIPPEFGNLGALEQLWLFENPRLGGPIPPELGNLGQLRWALMSSNRLTGTIPPELGNLKKLGILYLSSNDLEGPLPPELGGMTAMRDLDLSNNRGLTGSAPPEWGDMRGLWYLHFIDNENMRGVLPKTLANLASMRELSTRNTSLCVPLDEAFQTWLRGVDFWGDNCTVAEVERQALLQLYDETEGDSWTNSARWDGGSAIGGWHGVSTLSGRVRALELPDNALRGKLGPVLTNLEQLETLDLTDNDLFGELDPAYAGMGELRHLRLGGNSRMTGIIPREFVDSELETFVFGGTDLCASPSGTFQLWLAGLERWEGENCENPTEIRLDMLASLTQSVQTPSNEVRTVAGRDALLRVFLTATPGPAFYELPATATFTSNGSVLHEVRLERATDLLAEHLDEADLDASYNAIVPGSALQPGVEMRVEADVEGVPLQEQSVTSLSMALDVVETPPMELTVVPVLYADSPDSSVIDWAEGVGDDSPHVGLLKHAFPFGEFSAGSREPYVTSIDPLVDGWGITLELAAVHAMEGAEGYWYAAADSKEGYVRGIAQLNGWVSYGKPWATELAHEVGHNLDLRHAPCGGPDFLDPNFPYSDGSIGVWGYDFRDGSLVDPAFRRDIMGYCYDQGWLSDYFFERVIDVREEKEGDRAMAAEAAGPPAEALLVWGGLSEGELRIEPVHALSVAPRLPEGPGPYRVEGRGRGGRVEFSLSFAPDEDKFGNKYFFFFVPIQAGWEDSIEAIALSGPEGEVVVDAGDRRSITVVTDRATGRVRAMLRDWQGPLPTALGDVRGLETTITTGLRDAVRR